MTIYDEEELDDFINDIKEYDNREGWNEMEFLLETMLDVLYNNRIENNNVIIYNNIEDDEFEFGSE